jgi:transcriptional regulator with XRE-family HTH domain
VAKNQLREAVAANVVRILRDERKRRGLSMNQVAERSGLSQGMISLVEHDLRNPTLDTLLRIADALELDLSNVLKRANHKARSKRNVGNLSKRILSVSSR